MLLPSRAGGAPSPQAAPAAARRPPTPQQQQQQKAGGSADGQAGGEGEAAAPPPDTRTWWQKNWLFVMAGGTMVRLCVRSSCAKHFRLLFAAALHTAGAWQQCTELPRSAAPHTIVACASVRAAADSALLLLHAQVLNIALKAAVGDPQQAGQPGAAAAAAGARRPGGGR